MKCNICGAEIPEGSMTCPSCGTPVGSRVAPNNPDFEGIKARNARRFHSQLRVAVMVISVLYLIVFFSGTFLSYTGMDTRASTMGLISAIAGGFFALRNKSVMTLLSGILALLAAGSNFLHIFGRISDMHNEMFNDYAAADYTGFVVMSVISLVIFLIMAIAQILFFKTAVDSEPNR